MVCANSVEIRSAPQTMRSGNAPLSISIESIRLLMISNISIYIRQYAMAYRQLCHIDYMGAFGMEGQHIMI